MFFPAWSVIPFLVMLLSIAILPIVIPRRWEDNRFKLGVSLMLSIPILLLVIPREPSVLTQALADYFSFLVLIGALYIIAGGIFIHGAFAGTPLVNSLFLGAGAVLSNVIGTTGASMLLIRPFLRANRRRQRKTHLVLFFIFIVSNSGGLLTPLGDPPLYLGFLRGVPFHWTLKLIPHWGFVVGLLLVIFNFFDQFIFNREDVETPGALVEDVQPKRRLHVQGSRNFFYLVGVLLAVIASSYFGWPRGAKESIMIAMCLLSWFTTPRVIHEANHFNFHPIREVAVIFLGIFITMVPALEILNVQAASMKHIDQPWQYFWMSGIVSSFLDNAPTYLAFTAMAAGVVGGSAENLNTLVHSPVGEQLLRAVACGSVFMGAMTYIGNGPNFMVKSIAEHSGIKMPTFAGYMLYSIATLIPLFVVVTLIFFRP